MIRQPRNAKKCALKIAYTTRKPINVVFVLMEQSITNKFKNVKLPNAS